MNTIREVFKYNLISLRGQRQLKEVAAGADIPYRTYQNMEDGVIPQDETLAKIAQFHGVAPGQFFLDPDLTPEQPKMTPFEALDCIKETISALSERVKELESQQQPQQSGPRAKLIALINSLDDTQVRDYITMIQTELDAMTSTSARALSAPRKKTN